MTIHKLKIEEHYFNAVLSGRKNFEIRRNDRGYQAEDTVVLEEISNLTNGYTGRQISAHIGYVIGYKQQDNYVVFSLLNVELMD